MKILSIHTIHQSRFLIVALLLIAVLMGCSSGNNKNENKSGNPSHVEIKQNNGKYQFFINSQSFELKGVGLWLKRWIKIGYPFAFRREYNSYMGYPKR